MLKAYYEEGVVEAGCDEAGRGCLAGPVVAAAVVLSAGFSHPLLDDSKRMKRRDRDTLRVVLEREAVAWAVAAVSPERIDRVNILNASFEAMSLAVAAIMGGAMTKGGAAQDAGKVRLAEEIEAHESAVIRGGATLQPESLLIDGNRFRTTLDIPYRCIVGGDGLYASIAAASVLAKTHRDEKMERFAALFPHYGWARNMGYPTREHRAAIERHGLSPQHRRSFRMGVGV